MACVLDFKAGLTVISGHIDMLWNRTIIFAPAGAAHDLLEDYN